MFRASSLEMKFLQKLDELWKRHPVYLFLSSARNIADPDEDGDAMSRNPTRPVRLNKQTDNECIYTKKKKQRKTKYITSKSRTFLIKNVAFVLTTPRKPSKPLTRSKCMPCTTWEHLVHQYEQ